MNATIYENPQISMRLNSRLMTIYFRNL